MAAALPTIRTTTRKRKAVSYDPDDYFTSLDIVVDDADAAKDTIVEDAGYSHPDSNDRDGSFQGSREGRPRKKAKVVPRAKKAKVVKPFRFMDLPAELRDEIYELALTEPSGITIVSRTKESRRIVERGTIAVEETAFYSGKQQPRYRGFYGRSAAPGPATIIGKLHQTRLIPSLCAVSKQIREEASSVLYKQDIIFEDTTALHVWLHSIGPYNRRLVSDVTIKGWGVRKGTKPDNYAGLSLLADCANLNSLFIDCSIGTHRSDPRYVAKQIYQDAHIFLQAYGAANGSYDAGLDVLEMSQFHFMDIGDHYTPTGNFNQTKYDNFTEALRAYLTPRRRKN